LTNAFRKSGPKVMRKKAQKFVPGRRTRRKKKERKFRRKDVF